MDSRGKSISKRPSLEGRVGNFSKQRSEKSSDKVGVTCAFSFHHVCGISTEFKGIATQSAPNRDDRVARAAPTERVSRQARRASQVQWECENTIENVTHRTGNTISRDASQERPSIYWDAFEPLRANVERERVEEPAPVRLPVPTRARLGVGFMPGVRSSLEETDSSVPKANRAKRHDSARRYIHENDTARPALTRS